MRALDGDVVRFDEVTSTQDVARDLIAAGRARHGTCVVARVQTAGRGRRGRSWLSADGALAVSMIVEPACALVDAPLATLTQRSATIGRRVEVDGLTGVARRLAGDGALVVVDDAGVEHVVRAGDVWFSVSTP